MPKIVDEEERRRSIADAALVLIAREGLEGATFRAIAKERGLSLGAVQHSFESQAQLRQYVVRRFVQRVEARLAMLDENMACDSSWNGGLLEAAVALLLELLPLDEQRETEARVWEAFAHAAQKDSQIAPLCRQLDEALDAFCVSLVAQLKDSASVREDLDGQLEGIRLHALLDGLTLRLLIDPSRTSPSVAEAVLRRHLRSLA